MKVKVLPKWIAEQKVLQPGFFDDNVMISISCGMPLDIQLNLYERVKVPPVSFLPLIFDDVDPDALDLTRKYNLFDEQDAAEIISFLKNFDKSKNLYVHCAAGISRSGAVGLWASEKLGIDYQTFYEQNKQVKPNRYVLKILDKVWSQQHDPFDKLI